MRVFKLKVREISITEHLVKVPNTFTPYAEAEINDWISELSEQNSEPVEVLDVQVESILEATEVEIN